VTLTCRLRKRPIFRSDAANARSHLEDARVEVRKKIAAVLEVLCDEVKRP